MILKETVRFFGFRKRLQVSGALCHNEKDRTEKCCISWEIFIHSAGKYLSSETERKYRKRITGQRQHEDKRGERRRQIKSVLSDTKPIRHKIEESESSQKRKEKDMAGQGEHSYRKKDGCREGGCIVGWNERSMKEEKTFSEFLFQWLEYIRPRIKESSYVKYTNQIELHIDKEIGHLPVEGINTAVIDEFINTLLTGKEGIPPLSTKTVTDILGVVRNVIRYINIRYQRMDCDLSQIVIKKEESRMRILSREEEEQLIRYLMEYPSPMNCGIFLTLFTGLRIGEVCALTWQDIHLKEKEVYIRKTMQRIQNKNLNQNQEEEDSRTRIIITSPKSRKSIRCIPIPGGVAEILGEYERYGNEYLLTGRANRYVEPRTLQYHFKKVLRKSRIEEANYHALRHTFATRCIELGFDLKSLSEILGHASVNITLNRYVHPSMELKRDNMEKLSGLIAG